MSRYRTDLSRARGLGQRQVVDRGEGLARGPHHLRGSRLARADTVLRGDDNLVVPAVRQARDAGRPGSRCVGLGDPGAPQPCGNQRADQRLALQKLGPVLVQYFGLGEVTGCITVLPPHMHSADDADPNANIGACGRPRTGMEVAILDAQMNPVPVGTVGEICCRGPAVFAGYFNNEDATTKALRGGWFHTGDLGRLDARGLLYITGRESDMYISGGSNVYPREVEEILLTHPAVAEAAEAAHRELEALLSRSLDSVPGKRAILAEIVGLGEKSMQWAREIVHAADQGKTPVLRAIVEEMNRTGLPPFRSKAIGIDACFTTRPSRFRKTIRKSSPSERSEDICSEEILAERLS